MNTKMKILKQMMETNKMSYFKKYFHNKINEDEADGGEKSYDKEKIFDAIIDLFKENPKPEDSVVHELSDKMKIETHEFEDHIYELLGSFIGAGMSVKKNITEKDVDPKQLEIGIEVEYEHTTNKTVAKKIALDHLAEKEDYYSLLVGKGIADEEKAVELYKNL